MCTTGQPDIRRPHAPGASSWRGRLGRVSSLRDHTATEHEPERPEDGPGHESEGGSADELGTVVGGPEAWATVPDLVELLGTDVSRVRRLLDDRLLVGVRRGRPKVLQVPRVLADPEPLDRWLSVASH